MANGNPFYIDPSAGRGLASGLGQIGTAFLQKRQQDQAAEAQAMAQQEIQQALASGDPMQVQKVMAKYPEMARQIETGFQFRSQATRQNMADSAFRLLQGEDPQAVLQDRADFVTQMGGDPRDTLQGLDMEPEELQQSAMMMLAQYGTPQQLDLVKRMGIGGIPGDEATTAKLTEFDRWAGMQPGPEKDALAQILGIRKVGKTTIVPTPTGHNVVDESGNVVNRVKDPAKQKVFDAEQKKREQELKAKQREEEAKIRKADIEAQDLAFAQENAANQTIRALELTRELGEEGVIDAVTGAWDRLTPTLFGSSQDVINKGLELKDMLTMENLGLMQGVLTDRDIQILARAGSGLNVDEDGFIGSESGVRKQINKIQDMLVDRLRQSVKRGTLAQEQFDQIVGADEQPTTQFSPFTPGGRQPGAVAADQAAAMQEGTIAVNPTTGERVILRGGQWIPYGG